MNCGFLQKCDKYNSESECIGKCVTNTSAVIFLIGIILLGVIGLCINLSVCVKEKEEKKKAVYQPYEPPKKKITQPSPIHIQIK